MDLKETAQKKRKSQDSDGRHGKGSVTTKRLKALDARAIPAQSSEIALSKTGELDVASFVAAREYEIKALESSLANSKKELRLRAFQQVPRNMRRRTASYNVKRIPKRMRSRAAREMKEDNTPTFTKIRRANSIRLRLRIEGMKRTKRKVANARAKRKSKKSSKAQNTEADSCNARVPQIKKNVVSEPPTATSRFKKRQISKTWLPTHIWHAKRSHMTKPKEPLWRMAIPLSPTEKSYRPTHRAASSRGCVAWDVSYMATVAAIGAESSLKGLLKSVGFGVLLGGGDGPCWGRQGSKWVAGTRHEQGWARENDGEKRLIGPIMVVWCPGTLEPPSKMSSKDRTSGPEYSKGESSIGANEKPQPRQKPAKRQLFIRVHPSAFSQLWSELAKLSKIQKPVVTLEDLRFEVGTIELTGPGSTECLLGTLQPAISEGTNTSLSTSAKVFTALSGLTNAGSLPRNALIAFEACDPRLNHPVETVSVPSTDDSEAQASLAEMLAQWPLDSCSRPYTVFSQAKRVAACRSLPSQKAINRRKTLAPPGEKPARKRSDPQIPVMLLAANAESSNSQGSWTVLLPWKCVDAVWRCLMYYPISSGGQPRFGGLNEMRQVAFERGQAWFPGDFPVTQAGRAWLQMEAEIHQKAWERKPPGRRVNFETLDLKSRDGQEGELGNPWGCDWDFLFGIMDSTHKDENKSKEKATSTDCDASHSYSAVSARHGRTFAVSGDSSPEDKPSGRNCKLGPSLLTVKITLLTRGTPLPCARIYRLPSTAVDSRLRQEWLNLDPTPSKSFSFFEAQHPSKEDRRSSHPLPALPKDKINWRGDFRKHEVYGNERKALEDLSARFQGPEGDLQKKKQNSRSASSKRRSRLKETREHGHQTKENYVQSSNLRTIPSHQVSEEAPLALRSSRPQLIQSLLKPAACESPSHPQSPGRSDLIGFVTSGDYNLAAGRGMGFGSIWSQKLHHSWDQDRLLDTQYRPTERQKRLVIVRNAGETVGRLAIWQPIS